MNSKMLFSGVVFLVATVTIVSTYMRIFFFLLAKFSIVSFQINAQCNLPSGITATPIALAINNSKLGLPNTTDSQVTAILVGALKALANLPTPTALIFVIMSAFLALAELIPVGDWISAGCGC